MRGWKVPVALVVGAVLGHALTADALPGGPPQVTCADVGKDNRALAVALERDIQRLQATVIGVDRKLSRFLDR